MGMVEDQQGKLHSMTKVQPVPSSTRSTKTVRMERAVLPFRKARTDEACRAFIRDEVVPALPRADLRRESANRSPHGTAPAAPRRASSRAT